MVVNGDAHKGEDVWMRELLHSHDLFNNLSDFIGARNTWKSRTSKSKSQNDQKKD